MKQRPGRRVQEEKAVGWGQRPGALGAKLGVEVKGKGCERWASFFPGCGRCGEEGWERPVARPPIGETLIHCARYSWFCSPLLPPPPNIQPNTSLAIF